MCGIAGAIGQVVPEPRITSCLKKLEHRGPDAQGMRSFKMANAQVTLLHARLAILDLEQRSNQPFERDGLVLVFNGEIYNYREIREELVRKGFHFNTQSDTEVLLCAYQYWGEAVFDKLEGMWAFVLLDTKSNKILVSRDRFGEKPLYLQHVNGTLYFASEVKALAVLSGCKPALNDDRLSRYLVQGYKTLYRNEGETYFEGVSEFPAGHFAYLTKNGVERKQRYWDVKVAPNHQLTQDQAIEEISGLLEQSLKIRLRADVPLAFCLSGGVDSGILAGMAVKKMGMHIHGFSVVDEDPRYDERDMLDKTVAYLGCENHRVFASKEGFFERMERLVDFHDAPVVTLSYYMHSFLSEAIAAKGYKVSISGTAADEIFTGYYDHYSMWLAGRYQDSPNEFDQLVDDWREGYGSVVRNPLLRDPMAFVRNPDQRDHILLDSDTFNSFMHRPVNLPWSETHFQGGLLRKRMMNELFVEATPVILHEDDRNSMMFGIENRSPFLDRKLVEFLAEVPDRHLIGDGMAKYLLRQAGRGVMDDDVRLDKRKRGFNASILSLVDFENANVRERLLAESPIFDLIKRDAVEDIIKSDKQSNSFSKFAFSFISTKLFMDHHRDWEVKP